MEFYFSDHVYLHYHFLAVCEKANRYNVLRVSGVGEQLRYVPSPVMASRHGYKYSLFYDRDGLRLVSYDNERGKGDHKHVRDDEVPYTFTDLDRMIDDFMADVTAMREGKL